MKYYPSAFVDSDVVISSLLSYKGAAYILMHKQNLKRFISTLSYKELTIVVSRLNISKTKLDRLVKNKCAIIRLPQNMKALKQTYAKYTIDLNDVHILAGAIRSKTKFLISYNIKHFKAEIIKRDFDIIIYPPALFLQYLRGIK